MKSSIYGLLCLAFLCLSGCCPIRQKTVLSVYIEKDLWIERDWPEAQDARTRLEYRIEQVYEP